MDITLRAQIMSGLRKEKVNETGNHQLSHMVALHGELRFQKEKTNEKN